MAILAQASFKTCSKCGERKPFEAFSMHNGTKDGFRPNCKMCVSEYNAAYRKCNAERVRKSAAAWRSDNPDLMRRYKAAWRASNRDRALQATANWAKANPDRAREARAAWYAANPDARRIHKQNRRARKLENGGELSRGIAVKLLKLQKGKCACCNSDLSETGYHIDHIMPLALGGSNDDDNVQLLCPACNASKGAKNPVDFMQSRGFLL
jgi:hypothetical protein